MCTYNNCYKHIHTTFGFSTIEILIAFAVGIMFLTASLMIAYTDVSFRTQISLDTGQEATLDVMFDNTARRLSSHTLDTTLAFLSQNWNAVIQGTNDYIYTNAVHVTDIASCMKEIVTATTWNSLHNRERHVTFGTTLDNIEIAKTLGRGECDPTPPGIWDNPENTGLSITPENFIGKGTGIDIAPIEGETFAFITGTHTAGPASDFFVVNISNSQNPTLVHQADFAPFGYTKITVGGTYAYAIQNNTTTHLDVIDIHNPLNPVFLTSVSLPLAPNAIPRSIFYASGRLYIGTQYLACVTCVPIQNNEFHIYDVTTPATPVHLGSLNINHSVNDIYVDGNYAYLATSDNTAELMIIDIHNPASLIHPDDSGMFFNPSGNMDGTSVFILGNFAYLGRVRTTGSNFDFYKIDITNKTSPLAIKWKQLGLITGTAVTDVLVRGRVGFLITSDVTKAFQVWDIETGDTADIIPVHTCANVLNLAILKQFAYHDTLMYVVHENNATLTIIRDNQYACIP